jgi:hypothetical protein
MKIRSSSNSCTFRRSCAFLALMIAALLALTGSMLARTTNEPQNSAANGPRAQAAGVSRTQSAAKPATPVPKPAVPAPAPSPFLSARDKELLTEALRLKQILGDEVWPDFGSSAIPVIIYNEGYEFLTGPVNPLPQPPWVKVEKDDFAGQPYYRRPAQNPQAFAEDLGDRWAGSMTSLELMNRKAPFKLAPDLYVVAILHEVFHAFQATVETARFRRTMDLYTLERSYPAKDPAFAKAWTEEGALLAAALKAKDREQVLDGVRAFLRQRESRRRSLPFSLDAADYERGMEWLEGLAKYVEIRFYELAAARAQEPAFAAYKPGLPFWTWDFVRLEKQLGTQEGDLRFYLSGMAQARLLDRLAPEWKLHFFYYGGAMEDRLQALAQGRPLK